MLLLFLATGDARPQSLAELARKERERKGKAQQARSFTNDDLKGLENASVSVSGRPRVEPEAPEEISLAPEEARAREERDKKMAEAQARVTDLERRLTESELRSAELANQAQQEQRLVARQRIEGDLAALRGQMDQIRSELETARSQLESLRMDTVLSGDLARPKDFQEPEEGPRDRNGHGEAWWRARARSVDEFIDARLREVLPAGRDAALPQVQDPSDASADRAAASQAGSSQVPAGAAASRQAPSSQRPAAVEAYLASRANNTPTASQQERLQQLEAEHARLKQRLLEEARQAGAPASWIR